MIRSASDCFQTKLFNSPPSRHASKFEFLVTFSFTNFVWSHLFTHRVARNAKAVVHTGKLLFAMKSFHRHQVNLGAQNITMGLMVVILSTSWLHSLGSTGASSTSGIWHPGASYEGCTPGWNRSVHDKNWSLKERQPCLPPASQRVAKS